MVRKRSRKYASQDNDSDSDVEFDAETHSKPAPKKYSLRERKSTSNFLLDTSFDYFLEDEERCSSDDEFKIENFNATRPFFEPDPNIVPENSQGLIDFEDIIRADIVVNKNKIDYDNLIQKTEIKLNAPKKRGRKPKNKIEEDLKLENNECNNLVCEPELENLSEIQNETDEKGDEQNLLHNQAVIKTQELKNTVDAENGNIQEHNNESTSKVELTKFEASSPPAEMLKDNEDDDVIVLGELKQDVIVLDD